MILHRHIVAASSILLVLLSTPAVVKGTCTLECVCANSSAWKARGKCFPMTVANSGMYCDPKDNICHNSYSVCNSFGCNCEKCETGSGYDNRYDTCENPWELITGCVALVDGVCPTNECCNFGDYKPERVDTSGCCAEWQDGDGNLTVDQERFCQELSCKKRPNGSKRCEQFMRRMVEDEDKKEDDGCADFRYVRSLSAEGKRNLLADKYCLGADEVVRKDIFEVILSSVLSKYENVDLSKAKAYIKNKGGIDQVLTCDLFNKAYAETDDLTLCEDKPQHLDVVPASTGEKKGKKQKKDAVKKKQVPQERTAPVTKKRNKTKETKRIRIRNEYEYKKCGTEPVTKKRNETNAKRTAPYTKKKRNETKRMTARKI